MGAIGTIWDQWVDQFPRLFETGPSLTKGGRLVRFRDGFLHKIWVVCDRGLFYVCMYDEFIYAR